MYNNINNLDCVIKIGKTKFICAFDHKSIDILQTVTGVGFYKIYNNFLSHNLYAEDVLAVSTYKYHGILGLNNVRKILKKNNKFSVEDFAVFKVLFKNVLPQIDSFCSEWKKLNPNCNLMHNKSDYYNFNENYALARLVLNWSDSEFWASDPKKFCFALVSVLSYNKQKEEYLRKLQTEDSLNILCSVKNML